MNEKDKAALRDAANTILTVLADTPAVLFYEQDVKSSNVKRVKYVPEYKVLTVTFNSGLRYSYYGVPEYKYRELVNAESVGRYLNQEIKGVYDYEPVA